MIITIRSHKMPRKQVLKYFFFLLVLSPFTALFFPSHSSASPRISLCFSPEGKCTQEIVKVIAEAKKIILVQAYLFTSKPIAKALVEAQKNGVQVKIILDKNVLDENFSMPNFLAQAGIPIWLDGKHASAHNKVMILDGETVITGSFNFTKAADEKNAENLLILHDTDLAELYVKNWEGHVKHSKKFSSKKMGAEDE